jgi:3-oxoacyl-[acyl-carrier protein] reductase
VAIQPTFLLIADIAGYTRFMKFHRASLAHAQDIVAQLLEAVIDASHPGLTLAKLEGDAAFFYMSFPQGTEPDLEFVADRAAATPRHRRISDPASTPSSATAVCRPATKIAGRHLARPPAAGRIDRAGWRRRETAPDAEERRRFLNTCHDRVVHERIDADARMSVESRARPRRHRQDGENYVDPERYVGEVLQPAAVDAGAPGCHMKPVGRSFRKCSRACVGFRNVRCPPSRPTEERSCDSTTRWRRDRRGRDSARHCEAVRGRGAKVVVNDIDAAQGTASRHCRGEWRARFCMGDVSNDTDVGSWSASRSMRTAIRHRRQQRGYDAPQSAVAGRDRARIRPDLPRQREEPVSHRAARGAALRRKKRGVFITIASTAGVRPRPGLTWYNGSKGAAIVTSRSMAAELAPDGIRVNVINPVAGETGMLADFMGGDTPELRAKFVATIPLGRLSQPADIATAAVFLASDEAAFITGACLEVDGGRCV